ncbi:uncharacterized protein OCT59_018319 [Rhizophagus irregularis]|uniref:Ciga protein n=5 Tax=Rhizophagus irregularis TaxID=588596 RepID=A0A915ZEQ9_9GLOM|nr:hypothetical protein RirG_074220 [Rhizophagus irregularis DAOM 197198w]UZO26071.1 hypothetical protein OCT59_018319 [Rhizophagus irregularis]GET54829.1 CigA protein [Rhizophagus irregularis DAOM 181602=DAOM 197198]CAB5158222.1 unnamed protein product [Rhizophagus irregularis]CAB5374007.1 unnamed protein product [Rhizophagus irregularis]
MPYNEREQRQLQEFLLPNHDMPKTTNIGWLKNYFRGHFIPSIKKNILIIILFIICLIVLLNSQHILNDDNKNTNNSNESYDPSLIIEEDEDYKYFPSYSKNERFMTYLPHGDIFQQKDELENAVILAYSLNRTLIIPPIILGLNIEFINSKSLRKKLSSLGTNHNQSECFIKTIIPEHKETKYEIDINCLNDFVSYSLLRWDSLFNLNLIKKNIHLLYRKNFDQIKLEEMLNITNPINDIYDITKSSTLKDLNFIRSRNEKLLSFDYLSGLDFIENDHLIFLNQLNSSIELNNPVILDISNNIINEKLGGKKNYIGVHARLLSTLHSRKLIKETFSNLTLTLKDYFSSNNNNDDDLCIYLVTDLSRNDKILASFLSKFPCVKILSDFNEILLPLLELYNPIDGTFLFKFFEPLVNSIIVSNSVKLFTIDDSIYSNYAKKLYDEMV